MNIFDKVSEDIKKAMMAQNKVELLALRNIKKELLEVKTSKEAAGNLTDDMAMKVIAKLLKQNKEAAVLFSEQDRADLADEYNAQTQVLQRYLPKQMSAEELRVAVKGIIDSLGATSLQDLGRVMGVASKQLAGKADGRAIANEVKSLLSD